MIRRALVLAFVFATAGILLFLQNKVMTGTQDLQALVTMDQAQATITFRDVSGHIIPLDRDKGIDTEALIAQVRSRLAARPGAQGRAAIAVADDRIEVSPGKDLRLTLAKADDEQVLREAVQGLPFRRKNPPRDLFHINRGIDLRGGVEFICRLYDNSNHPQKATSDEVAILRKRLDARGLTEPQVARLSNGDVHVVIPGGTEADAAATRKVLETAGLLEFREVKGYYNRGDLGTKLRKLENGHITFGAEFGPHDFEDTIYPKKPKFAGDEPDSYVHVGPAKLTGADVERAEPGLRDGRPCVDITFTSKGGALNQEFTEDVFNRGPERGSTKSTGVIAISFDGVIESDPKIISPSSHSCQITGSFTMEEVQNLKDVLTAGALTRTPRVLSQQVVGASLGAETVTKATGSMAASLVLIIGFMMFFYWWRLGSVAVAGLFATTGLVFVSLSVFGATLTLPGLAGLVLTAAMAVDANILIYERLREELERDMDLKSCIEKAYARAWITILDSNLTTFITAFILYQVGSGPVQGFGLSLMIGLVAQLFGSCYLGRFLTDLLYARSRTAKVRHLGTLPLPYMRFRKVFLTASAAVGLGGLGFFFFGKPLESNFDIDFTGGNQLQITFAKPLTAPEVNEHLDRFFQKDKTAHDVLDPRRIQALPYYKDFGLGGAASRQWIFKGPDPKGAGIERVRADLEDQRGEWRLEAGRLRDKEPAKAAELQKRIDDTEARVIELTTQVEARQAEIKALFRQAFTDANASLIRDEGSEVQAAAWTGSTLELSLAVLETPSANVLAQVRERLEARDEIRSVTITAGGSAESPVLAFRAEYTSAPAAMEELSRDPVTAALDRLLTKAGVDDKVRHGQVRTAHQFYEMAMERLAPFGVAIDRSFPSTQTFSPQVASRMKWMALLALTISLLAILAYVAARFEFFFGIGAIVSLAHDVALTVGVISLLGIRIDLTVVAALLTIIGYSLNDSIVVFDRIRENLKLLAGKPLLELIDTSIAQTMSRTILTGSCAIGAVIILIVWGGEGVYAFSVTMLVGMLFGTYSSVFVACPALLLRGDSTDLKKLVEEAESDGEPQDDEPSATAPAAPQA